MRIAVVSLYEAYPPTSGAAVVTYALANHLDGDVLLCQLGERSSVQQLTPRLEVLTIAGGSGGRIGKLLGMGGFIKSICHELKRFRADVVVLEGASWAVYLACLAVNIRRRMPNIRLAYHAHNVEYLLRKVKSGPIIGALTRAAEQYLVTKCEGAYAVSLVDQEAFLKLYGRRLGLVPNGVSIEEFQLASEDRLLALKNSLGIGDAAILFTGLYAYPPNRYAVDFLLGKVMPLVLTARPEAQLIVTGGAVPFRAPWFVNPGTLPRADMIAVMQACKVSACPIFSGSGTRLKILEAAAARLPLVSTAKGAEGLGFVSGDHFLQAETAEEFADRLLQLLAGNGFAACLADRAWTFANSRFRWEGISLEFQQRLHRLVGSQPESP